MGDSIGDELKSILYESGASLVGFADLRSIAKPDMPYGISVAVAIPAEIVESIHGGPNLAYYDAYYALNEKLDGLVTAGQEFLKSRGYRAYAQTTDAVREFDTYRTELPHKTVATNAGLGWIGKSALLVTEQFGPAVRISSLVTNAPLECAAPIAESKCGGCMVCTNACPGKAISGKLWRANLDRDEFFDPLACRKKARALSAEKMNKEITLCGKCIEICPYTQRYLHTAK
jgi:epoxyqueuosine reductase QueG